MRSRTDTVVVDCREERRRGVWPHLKHMRWAREKMVTRDGNRHGR